LILKSPYDECWECNDYLFWHMYSISSPTSTPLNEECFDMFKNYNRLNRKRKYLMPEENLKGTRAEEKENGKSFQDFLDELHD
jgi:hypothetical protein